VPVFAVPQKARRPFIRCLQYGPDRPFIHGGPTVREGMAVKVGRGPVGLRTQGRGLRIFASAAVAAGMVVAGVVAIPAAAQASPQKPLTVTFTFDDGVTDQLAGQALLEKYGMVGTFYINSALVGQAGYLSRADLDTLSANGHEIGGHTVSHPDLTTLNAQEVDRQICQDRDTLSSWGFTVTSLAYPFAEYDATVEGVAAHCGYDTARAVGDLWSPRSCGDCPSTETVPPADRFATRTPDDVESNWTLADLQAVVLNAEDDGGWLPFNLHHVCDGCALESIPAALLDEFLAWLQPRTAVGTTVRTVRQALGGTVNPVVAAAPAPDPGAPGVNTVRNPSFEDPVAGTDPGCWQGAGYGSNTETHGRVADAHSGTYGARITMSDHTDGDAKMVPAFDLGSCSLQAAAGHAYEVSAWYKSDVQVFFTLYRRSPVGRWSYWTQSPRLAPAAGWTRASWVAPPVPADVAGVSFGLTIDGVGTLTTDDYGFVDTPALPEPAPPGVNALRNASLETPGADGFPQCWTGAGYGTNTPQWTRVTDAADGSYAQQLEITSWTDGDAKLVPAWDSVNCAPTVRTGTTYALSVAYKSTAPVFFTVYRQSDDGVWAYWTQSPPLPATAGYSTAQFTTPVVPAGTRSVTFGLTLPGTGVLTTDAYAMTATE
jgi:peptidoglycan/xylan/chitin deacetylase (PgdA/CDA1 family)